MELGTFGAIVGFAMELEQRALDFYKTAPDVIPEAICAELERGYGKRLKRLERARREMVAEMILESISGLDSDTYAVTLQPGAKDALQQARELEAMIIRFYENAAAKLPIREVVRLFERLAEEHNRLDIRLGNI